MKLITYISERGKQSVLARLLGMQPVSVHQWARGIRPIPADRCSDIERATGGAVTCEELRPDLSWQRVPDPSWPHPAGRPLVDYARTKKEAA